MESGVKCTIIFHKGCDSKDQNLLRITLFQRVSRCLGLWRAMSTALSVSSLQMAGILLELSRFPKHSTSARADSSIFQGFDQTINLILDETHERVYSATQGVEQVSLDFAFPSWILAKTKYLIGLFRVGWICHFRLCWDCTLSGVTTFVWWANPLHSLTKTLNFAFMA